MLQVDKFQKVTFFSSLSDNLNRNSTRQQYCCLKFPFKFFDKKWQIKETFWKLLNCNSVFSKKAIRIYEMYQSWKLFSLEQGETISCISSDSLRIENQGQIL